MLVSSSTYQFKVQIKGITQPPVWRRIIMPAEASFIDFHHAIQVSFGWHNAHLYEFADKSFGYGLSIKEPNEFDDEFEYSDVRDAASTPLSSVFLKEGDKLIYVYDFGDSWEHKITLEKIAEESIEKPNCIAGKGKCPPEDCGGIGGYAYMKHVLVDKSHEEHDTFLEWLGLDDGSDWNPHEFNVVDAQKMLNNVF